MLYAKQPRLGIVPGRGKNRIPQQVFELLRDACIGGKYNRHVGTLRPCHPRREQSCEQNPSNRSVVIRRLAQAVATTQ